MNETTAAPTAEAQESSEQIPANQRQESTTPPAAADFPSTSDSSPKLDEKIIDIITSVPPKKPSLPEKQQSASSTTDSMSYTLADITSTTSTIITTPTINITSNTTLKTAPATAGVVPSESMSSVTAAATSVATTTNTGTSLSIALGISPIPSKSSVTGASLTSTSLLPLYLQKISYCNLHVHQSSPTRSCKSLKHRFRASKTDKHLESQQQHQSSFVELSPPPLLQQSNQQASAIINMSSEFGLSSESETSESSCDDYIHRSKRQQQKSIRKKSSQEESLQYPLQFVCVETNCTEESKLCCVKCLSSGLHENHQAICAKALESQVNSAQISSKLMQFGEQIRSKFDELFHKLSQCQDDVMKQYAAACAYLDNQVMSSSNRHSVEKTAKLWKAINQPEKSPMMDHINFILEQGQAFINSIQSKTSNLNTHTLLFSRQLTSADVQFQRELKSIEDELAKQELNLSSRVKQALVAMPQFQFNNPELENASSIGVKKFEFPERIEFSQIDRNGEQNGRSLIFWRDGAYRIGYSRGGESQGTCRMIWENGNVYEGNYIDDRKEGTGCFVKFSDNTSYHGEFVNDAKNGKGIEYYRNATHYIGQFKNWKPHGEGSLVDTQTKHVIKSGIWKNGKFISETNILLPH